MGRKRKTGETSHEYGALIVSFLLNSIEFFVTPEQKPSPDAAGKLENDLAFLFKIPEIKKAMRNYVDGLKGISTREWEAETIKYTQNCKQMLLTLPVEGEHFWHYANLPPKKFAHVWLSRVWRLKGPFEKQAADWKQLLIDIFEKMISGELGPAYWSQELKGTFQNEPAKALAIMRLVLQLRSNALIKQVDDAVKMLRDKLLTSSPEFKAAVAFAEKQFHLGKDNTNQRVSDWWAKRRPGIMGMIIGSDLRIPDAHDVDRLNRKTWSEEESIAFALVFPVLLERAIENPFRLIQDAIDGTLSNYLTKAIENAILMEIRHRKAKQRDFDKIDRSADVHNEDSSKISRALARVSPEDPLDQIIDKENWEKWTKGLTSEEKNILERRIQGDTNEEIAHDYGKSLTWVKEKFRVIRRKMGPPNNN